MNCSQEDTATRRSYRCAPVSIRTAISPRSKRPSTLAAALTVRRKPTRKSLCSAGGDWRACIECRRSAARLIARIPIRFLAPKRARRAVRRSCSRLSRTWTSSPRRWASMLSNCAEEIFCATAMPIPWVRSGAIFSWAKCWSAWSKLPAGKRAERRKTAAGAWRSMIAARRKGKQARH